MILPKSSTIASAVKKTFKLVGQLLPRMAKTPIAKAISVAIGIPHPCAAGVPPLNIVKIKAGKIIPPSAAKIGNIAFLGWANSPTNNSRLISRPTKKKKVAIKPSLIHFKNVIFKEKFPISTPISTFQMFSRCDSEGILATMTANIAQKNNIIPPIDPLLAKC